MIKKTLAITTGIMMGSTAFSACPGGTKASPVNVDNKETCILKGSYRMDMVLDNEKVWVLAGGVFIGGDNDQQATLTIQPGTKIVGQSGADFLVVNRGSKIFAEGTKESPIVFTSSKAPGKRNRGDWGGLIINGNAPINGCGQTALCEAEGEGNTGKYGGSDPVDSSGVLKYVRVEFAGNEISPDNELNGIAFQGVGSGTTVDYIQVHMNADDGVEFFGGTVNAKHVLLTGNRDDSLDWVRGWQGKMQYVIVDQFDDQANNGIEADNLKSPQDASPRSNPMISNMTLIGTTGAEAKGGSGLLLRRGTGLVLMNTAITGFKNSCIDIDDAATFPHVQITSTVVDCETNFTIEEGDVFNTAEWFNDVDNNLEAKIALQGYAPDTLSVLLSIDPTVPFDYFFDEVDFAGAIKSADSDWTKEWTISSRN